MRRIRRRPCTHTRSTRESFSRRLPPGVRTRRKKATRTKAIPASGRLRSWDWGLVASQSRFCLETRRHLDDHGCAHLHRTGWKNARTIQRVSKLMDTKCTHRRATSRTPSQQRYHPEQTRSASSASKTHLHLRSGGRHQKRKTMCGPTFPGTIHVRREEQDQK